MTDDLVMRPIGRIASSLTDAAAAPRQGDEGAPAATIVFTPEIRQAWRDLSVGDRIVVITWLDRGDRATLAVHPRGDTSRTPLGVFSTRSPDRPNPIGLHDATIVAITDDGVQLDGIEALDGTPVVDVKPFLGPVDSR